MKHFLRKTACIMLAVLFVVLSVPGVSAVGSPIDEAFVKRQLMRIETDMYDVITPKKNAVASFEGLSRTGAFMLSVDFKPNGINFRVDILVAYDKRTGEYVAEPTLYFADGSTLAAQLYTNGEILTLRVDELFGYGKTYAVKLEDTETMFTKFRDSALAKALGVDAASVDDAIAELPEIEQVFEFLVKYMKETQELSGSSNEMTKKLLETAEMTFGEETITLLSGKDTEVYSANIRYDMDAYMLFMKEMMRNLFAEYPFVGDLDMTAELDVLSFGNMVQTVYFDRKTTRPVSNRVVFSASVEEEGQKMLMDFYANSEADENALRTTVSMAVGENEQDKMDMDVAFDIAMEEHYKYTSWSGAMTMTDLSDEQSEQPIVINYTLICDERSGRYTLTLSLPRSGFYVDIIIEGDLIISETDFHFSLDTIKMCSPEMDLTEMYAEMLGISNQEMTEMAEQYGIQLINPAIEESVAIPDISLSYVGRAEIKAPKKYTMLFDMTEEEIFAFIARIKLNGKRLVEKLDKALTPKNASKVKKVYALRYEDYPLYADQYTPEEFIALVSNYRTYIDTNTSY